ncbi:MAG: hypothetical protein ABIH21_03710 [Patescibacteria group bacterium]
MSPERKSSKIEVGAVKEIVGEESEVQARKGLDLYQKALMNDDYDTADHLDLSGLSAEELKKAREEVFTQKIDSIRLGWKAEIMAGQIKTLQNKLGISDELTAAEVRKFCITKLKTPFTIKKGRQGNRFALDYDPGFTKIIRDDLPQQFGFEFSASELQDIKEDGFVEFVDGYGLDVLRSEKDLSSVLKRFDLYDSIVESKKMKKMIARRIVEELSVADRSSHSYKFGSTVRLDRNKGQKELVLEGYPALSTILSHKKEPYFPVEGLRVPEIQAQIDQWFSSAIGELPQTELKEKDLAELENIFGVNEVVDASSELLSTQETKALTSQYLTQYFDSSPASLVQSMSISPDQIEKTGFSAEELQQMAKSGFLDFVKQQDISKANDVVEKFALPESFLNSPQAVEVRTQAVKHFIEKKDYRQLRQFLLFKSLALPDSVLHSEEMTALKQQLIIDTITEYPDPHTVKVFVEMLDFSNCPDFFTSDVLQEKVTSLLYKHLAPFLQKYLEVPGSIGQSMNLDYERKGDYLEPKYGSHQEDKFGVNILFRAVQTAETLQNGHLIDYLFADELRRVTQDLDQVEAFSKIRSPFKDRKKLNELFGLYEGVPGELVFDFLLDAAEKGPEASKDTRVLPLILTSQTIYKFQKEFDLNNLQAEDLAIKAFEFFAKNAHVIESHPVLGKWHIDDCNKEADGLAIAFNLSPAKTREGATALYSAWLNNTGWGSAHNVEQSMAVKEKYKLDVDVTVLEQQKLNQQEEKFLAALRHQDVQRLHGFIEEGIISQEFAERHDVREMALAMLKKILTDQEQTKEARELATVFLPDLNGETIIAMNSVATQNFELLKEKFPALAVRVVASVDAAISIFTPLQSENFVSILQEHPFLEQAIIDNEQYGNKLLFKFRSLDKLSRVNIETMYRFKSEVLDENLDIEADSPEFRISMQEKLKDYRRNDEILRSLEKIGVDIEAWLTYDEDQLFDLGQETAVSFSEMIITPIKRIETSLDHYKATITSVLEEYKKELSAAQIPARDIDTLKKQLIKMMAQREEAERFGDSDKAAGVEKGIRNLEGQIAKVKTISIWKKIHNNMKGFEVVKNTVFKIYDEIVQLEVELTQEKDGTPAEKRKFIATNKIKTKKAKQRLRENMAKLESRVENFKAILYPLLTQALNTDWADSITQEIQERVGEHMDHYNSDRTTLANIFVEKESRMDGKPMRIGLWSRNPDQDLYLGNYTDCCIRIDSEHMGAESVIADYVTDLGMQIVAIYDEQKGIPVVVAWCWIGIDNDDSTAFVVDNIEADTTYSSRYKDQLEKQLSEFIEKLAAKIGLPHVVQGMSNNDLIIANMDSAYYKLGGYNRASGYYLEAEGKGHGDEWEEEFEDEDEEEYDDDV